MSDSEAVVVTAVTDASAPVEPVLADGAPELAPEAPKAPPVDDKFAAKFAALSRKESSLKARAAQIAQQEQTVNARLKELETKLAEREAEVGKYKGYQEKVKLNPLQTLAEDGIDFETLTKMQLNEQNPTTEMQIARLQKQMDDKYGKQLEELKSQLAEKEKKAQDTQIEQAKTNYMANIRSTVSNQPDKYELIANTPYGGDETSAPLVFEVVEEYYNKTQRVLDVQEAADMVEKHLETIELERREKIKKLKTVSAAAPATKPTAAKQTAPTLSNSLAAESPKAGLRKLSREEALKEAAKLIQWED